MKEYEIYNKLKKVSIIVDENILKTLDLTGLKHLEIKEIKK